MWLVLSNGTAPATGESGGQPQICWHPRGTATVNTAATLSLVSANAGLYHVELSASEVSCLGVFSLHYRSATAIAQTVFGKVVNYDSGDSVRFGQFSLPNAAAEAAGGLITFGTGSGQLHVSSGSVGLKAQTHSQVTIQGLSNYANISNVTLHAGTHSNVTIQGLSNYANISNVTLHPGNHSGASVEIKTGGIQSSSFGAGAVDAVALATDAGQEIADRVITRNIEGGSDTGRTVAQALAVLRNKVRIDGSTVTVYGTDDTTSSWTGTVTTGTDPIAGVSPGAP